MSLNDVDGKHPAMSSDPQAAIEGRLATIVQCTNVKPCVMCDRQAEIIRTDLAALLEQAQRETMWQGSDNGEDWVDVGPDEADAECYGYKRKIFLPPTGDAVP